MPRTRAGQNQRRDRRSHEEQELRVAAVAEQDRAVRQKVAAAQRALQEALRICRMARQGRAAEGRRARAVERDLSRALGALGSVRRLSPLYDLTDPDLMSEDERMEQWRAEQEAAAQAQAQALATEPVEVG
jgi:hypothetical protein